MLKDLLKMSNEKYDALKKLAQKQLPAIAATYALFAPVLNLPHPTIIAGVIMLADTLLGIALDTSTKYYNAETGDIEKTV